MCHIFYNNFYFIFLQHAQKRPQKTFQTKILQMTSSVNHCFITNASDKRHWNVTSPNMSISLQQSCLLVNNTNQDTLNFNESCHARKVLPIQARQRQKFAIVWKHASYAQSRQRRIPVSFVNCISNEAVIDRMNDVIYRILAWKVFCGRFKAC